MTLTRRNILTSFATAPLLLGLDGLIRSAMADNHTGTLRVAVAKASTNLDARDYVAQFQLQDLIYEPLIRYGERGAPVPCLAESWSLSDNDTRLTLNLRKNVSFTDGHPFDADSAIWNLKLWMGVADNSWINASKFFSGVQKIDEHTIEIKFTQPVPGLMYELSYVRPVRFLSPISVNEDGTLKAPVGTGPWIVQANSTSGSSFIRNDKYWGDKPSFSGIEITVMPDSRSRVDAMRSDELDIVGGGAAALTSQEADTLRRAGINVITAQGSMTMVLSFNTQRNPALAEKAVRQAIDVGYDRTAVSAVLFNGDAAPAGDLLGPTVPLSGTRHDAPVRDVEQAKQLLENAGWTGAPYRSKSGKNLSLELLVSDDFIAGSKVFGEILQQQLGEIGINVTVHSVDHASRHSEIPKREYDIAIFQTYGAPYDPFGSVTLLFLSTIESGSDGKVALDPSLDPLIAAATEAVGVEAQLAALQVFYDKLREDVLYSPVLYPPTYWAASSRVEGFNVPPTDTEFPYRGMVLKS
ncbi:ABC transporter substrate-binding protein [Mesorhizobium sp. LSJC268A00]|uniref:ABC transporter substrate-binding protein n=1 Tax=unclassified Mesorhizobium TaxID=325217 RepID=UPI0003CEAB78|nr:MULTISPECIES: ABC transporter substrate-binding protein [unclassified Mesorhizobium]ESW93183.1 ABC transporter substrate-binding protein [Mesorhizobium sp. LSJC269B00]ESX06600.1 ABC transporter substrate-binding protein [Mesorhizobium sp. LSJC268A00]ESX27739.1 ABC transporter substrate-binding protein [Mesorhizobium sp. LSJC264A00]